MRRLCRVAFDIVESPVPEEIGTDAFIPRCLWTKGMTDEAVRELPARRRFSFGAASSQFGLLVIIIAFWVVFSWRAPGFVSSFNLFSVGRALAVDIVIGFAQMAALATGGMNLSVGSIGVCAVMMLFAVTAGSALRGNAMHAARARRASIFLITRISIFTEFLARAPR